MSGVKKQKAFAFRRMLSAGLILLVFSLLSLPAAAETDPQPVRVSYYENEVFQEGAQPGAFKTGYAYEYYQKLAEYSCL